MIYAFAEYELDTERYELRSEGVSHHLEPQVFDVLAYLLAHRDRVVGRDELLTQVWGHTYVSEATLSSRVMAARKAVGDDGREQGLIKTLRGRGYRFVGAVEDRAAAAPAAAPGSSRPAVAPIGREAELGELSALLEAARAGRRQFALVTGEAGAGKTTLVERFAEIAVGESSLLVASGRCLEYRGATEPFMPVLDALAAVSRRAEGEGLVPATLAELAPTWLAQMPGLSGDQPAAADGSGADPQPERMLREMTDALEALAAEVPVVLALDDLHWADASTLALLGHLARRAEPSRLLIVGTARPASGAVDELRRELRPRGMCVELALPLLGTDDVGAYLEERYPGSLELADLVHQRTNGNPMFMDCLLRSWVDSRALEPEGGHWHLRVPERELATYVPDTLRELLDQDIERLAAEDQHVLEVASVVGAEFSAAAAAAALDRDSEEIERRCTELARRGRFLRQRGAEEWPDGTVAAAFSFVHDLHRQVLYERIPAGLRARLHGDIAARLESGYGGDAPERAAELATHHLEAREPAAAIRYLRLAAERAVRRGGHRDAVYDLTTALNVVERTPELPDRERQELALQEVLWGTMVATEGWSSAGAEAACRRGIELARKLGDDRVLAALLYSLAALHEYRGEYPMSAALIDEALRVEGADREAARLLEAHELLSCSQFHQGSFTTAIDQANRGLDLCAPGQEHRMLSFCGEDPAVGCNDWAGLALWCVGDHEAALERIAAALELAGAPGRAHSLASARVQAARLHQLRGDAEPALADAEAAVALATERGFAYHRATARILEGWALTALGRHDVGIDRMREGLDAHQATGATMDRPYFLALLADGLRAAGRPAEGLAVIDEALEMLGNDRTFFYEPELHRLRGELTLAANGSGALDRALPSLELAVDAARRQGSSSLELRGSLSLAAGLREKGETDDALATLADACAAFEESADSPDLAAARALIAELETGVAGRA